MDETPRWGIEPVPERLRVLGDARLAPALDEPRHLAARARRRRVVLRRSRCKQALLATLVGGLIGNALLGVAAADRRRRARAGDGAPARAARAARLLPRDRAQRAAVPRLVDLRAHRSSRPPPARSRDGSSACTRSGSGSSSSARSRLCSRCSGRSASSAASCASSRSGRCSPRSSTSPWWIARDTATSHALVAPAASGGSFWLGVDLVIALTVSWMPLAADYTRFSRDAARRRSGGAGVGYLLPTLWSIRPRRDPRALASGDRRRDRRADDASRPAGRLAARAPRARRSTRREKAFANIYSTAVSLQNFFPRVSQRLLIMSSRSLATAIALVLNLTQLPALPLPARLVLRAALRRAARRLAPRRAATTRGRTLRGPAWRPGMIVAWLVGFCLYQWLSPVGPRLLDEASSTRTHPPHGAVGASLPSFGARVRCSRSPLTLAELVRPLAVIGHLSRDVVAGAPPRIGGGPWHAARALRALGARRRRRREVRRGRRDAFRAALAALGVPLSLAARRRDDGVLVLLRRRRRADDDGRRDRRAVARRRPRGRCSTGRVAARRAAPARRLRRRDARAARAPAALLLDGQGLVARAASSARSRSTRTSTADLLRHVVDPQARRGGGRRVVGDAARSSTCRRSSSRTARRGATCHAGRRRAHPGAAGRRRPDRRRRHVRGRLSRRARRRPRPVGAAAARRALVAALLAGAP